MAEDTEKRTQAQPEDTTEAQGKEAKQRVLDEQRLVNERESAPGEFGGMAERPVESQRPRAEQSGDAIPPEQPARDAGKNEDIEMEGS